MHKTLCTLLLALTPALAIANTPDVRQELEDADAPSNWEGMIEINHQVKRSGNGSFQLHGAYPTELIWGKMIPVDMNRQYTLSVWLRTLDPDHPASAFMGLRMYDGDKHPITIKNVSAQPDTETTLLEAAAPGDKMLLVPRSDEWLKLEHGAVAFHVEPDYGDLPNYDVSPQIDTVEAVGDRCRVTFRSPLKKGYAAGTAVRLHAPWQAPFYWAASGWIPAQWTEYGAILTGEAAALAPANKFWPGTRYVRPFVWFGNYNRVPTEEARLLVDNISFTSVPAPRTDVVGHLDWPEQWTLFGPMQKQHHIDAATYDAVPSELEIDGKRFAAKTVQKPNGTIDFKKVYGAFDKEDVAYVFGMITTEQAGEVTLGLGADWWMQVWLDGELVCDTSATGNGAWPPSMADHQRVISLTAGDHLLVVRFIGGSGGAQLTMGGPDQLRALEQRTTEKQQQRGEAGQSSD